jgi:hypothetical protein
MARALTERQREGLCGSDSKAANDAKNAVIRERQKRERPSRDCAESEAECAEVGTSLALLLSGSAPRAAGARCAAPGRRPRPPLPAATLAPCTRNPTLNGMRDGQFLAVQPLDFN